MCIIHSILQNSIKDAMSSRLTDMLVANVTTNNSWPYQGDHRDGKTQQHHHSDCQEDPALADTVMPSSASC